MVDPGFPRGGGANPGEGGGCQHTILPNFLKNCMKFGLRGGHVPLAPLRSTTETVGKGQKLGREGTVFLVSPL